MIKILHIDDDQVEFEILSIHMSNLASDIDLDWAGSGEKALELMKENEYSCVLCDFQMPVMNGFEILSNARQAKIQTPFIFLTGQGNEEIAVEAFRAGAEDYYTKEEGFAHYDRLISRIRNIVEKEKVIRSSRFILQNTFNAIPELLCVHDRDFKVIMSNWDSRFPELKNGTDESTFLKKFWGKDTCCDECMATEVFKTGEPVSVRRNISYGNIGFVQISVYPVYDNKGEVVYVTEHIREINDGVVSKDALLEKEKNYHLILNSIQAGVMVTEEETGKIVTINDAALAMLNCDDSEINSCDLRNRFKCRDESFLDKTNESVSKVCILKSCDGKEIPVVATLKKIQIQDRTCLVQSFNQISEQDDISSEALESIVAPEIAEELLLMGSWYWNLKTNSFSMSNQMKKIFCFAEGGEFTSLYEMLKTRVHEADVEFCERSRKGVLNEAFELRIETADGTKWIYFSPIKVIKYSDNQQPKEIFGVIQDVTERKEFENQLALSNYRMLMTNEELESFSYTVSHDLRSPLRHIRGYLDILLTDYAASLDQQGLKFMKKVKSSAESMDNLIEDLLMLSRSTRIELNKSDVNISAAVETILQDISDGEPEREVKFDIEQGLQHFADESVLDIILANLLNNAWKFTRENEITEISFSSFENDQERVYVISDNGTGFNQANADELFTAFKRFHKQSNFPGTGIGLATVKRMLEKHGGRVWAEGEEGVGAKFYFTLG